MAIARRHQPLTPSQKHAWRIQNAQQNIAHFKSKKNPLRLTIWQGVLEVLQKRSAKEVVRLEREAEANMQVVHSVLVRSALKAPT